MRNGIQIVMLSLVLVFSMHARAHQEMARCTMPLHAAGYAAKALHDWHHIEEVWLERICARLIVSVRDELLRQEPNLRDEAYTTILWLRMDAESFLELGEYLACIRAMTTVKQIAG